MQLGFTLETVFGTGRFIAVILLSAVQANAAAMIALPYSVTAGASASVCCLLGCQLVWILHSKQVLTSGLLGCYGAMLIFVFSTCFWPYTSVLGGLVAFLSGILLSAVLFPLEFAHETKQICIRTSAALLWLSLALLLYLHANTLTFDGCISLSYFDREGFLYAAGPSCEEFCSEY